MTWLFQQRPSALAAVKVAGAIYLTWLGLRVLWRAAAEHERGPARFPVIGQTLHPAIGPVPGGTFVTRGLLTNLLNPPVILFYMTVLPQFMRPEDPVPVRLALLGATHVAMSVVWQGSCGLAAAVAADRLARPAVRRTLEAITGAILVLLGMRLIV